MGSSIELFNRAIRNSSGGLRPSVCVYGSGRENAMASSDEQNVGAQLPAGLATKLAEMDRRQSELERLLGDPEVLAKPGMYRSYVREHGRLTKTVADYRKLRQAEPRSRRLRR